MRKEHLYSGIKYTGAGILLVSSTIMAGEGALVVIDSLDRPFSDLVNLSLASSLSFSLYILGVKLGRKSFLDEFDI